jgi:catechol 2,3-dioxygenase-like lactoylglutathione lyase family enzyme
VRRKSSPRPPRLAAIALPIRIGAVTLACRDIGRMAAFYRQFGWPEAPTSVPEHVVFQCENGVVLGLFSDTVLERDHGPVAGGFRGFALTIHCEDESAVFRAHETVRELDDVRELDERPERSGWGCGFSFCDPEGNVWDVAFKHGAGFDDRGGFFYP